MDLSFTSPVTVLTRMNILCLAAALWRMSNVALSDIDLLWYT